MKKIATIVMAALVAVSSLSAQTQKEVIKEAKQMDRYTEQLLNEKATKAARKAAKQFKKEKWVVAPGHLPIEKQLDRSYKMQLEPANDGTQKWIGADAQSVGENYDAAKFQAMELVKINIAGQIQSEISALVETTVGNSQLPKEQAASITETVAASKNAIAAKLGRVIPVVECYREIAHKGKEVRVLAYYDKSSAMESAKQTIREELEKKGDKLHEQLDKLLGF